LKKLSIWHTNDVHSRFREYTGLAGYARRHADPGNDLILDAGDFADRISVMVSGTSGLGAMRLAKEAGVSAMAVGNNEFFAGIEDLKAMAAAGPAMLSCNITDLEGQPISGIRPYMLIERCGARILLIGCSPYFTHVSFFTDNAGVKLIDPAEVIPGIIEKEKGNYDICILLSHAGIWRDVPMAEKISGIDIIIGGHSHTFMDEPRLEAGTVIDHAGCYAAQLGKLDVYLDENNRIVSVSGQYIRGIQQSAPDLEAVLDEELEKGRAVLGKTLFTIDRSLEFDPFSECPACNAVADSLYNEYGGDFAMINNGILEKGLGGEISRLSLLEVSPSILNPTTVWWKGSAVREALISSFDPEYIRQDGKGPGFRGKVLGTLAVSRNVRVECVMKDGRAMSVDVYIDGEPLDDSRVYCVTADDYMYRGVAGYTMLKGSLQPEIYHNGYIRDMLEKTLQDRNIVEGAQIMRVSVRDYLQK